MSDLLTFDAASHVYRDKDGRPVPGVTRVINTIITPNAFSMVSAELLEAASDFGRNVHHACHLLNGDELDEEALDPELIPYVNGWKRCVRETGMTVRASEIRVFHKRYRYAGTYDVLATIACKDWMVDIKSGLVPWTTGYQTAAYQEAISPKPKGRLCVQLKPDDYSITEYKSTADFPVFLHALALFNELTARRKLPNVSATA